MYKYSVYFTYEYTVTMETVFYQAYTFYIVGLGFHGNRI